MEKPPYDDAPELDEEQTSSEDDLVESGVAPEPAANDPVQEALAMAEAVAPGTSPYFADRPAADAEIGDSTSLRQVIDRIEQRLIPARAADPDERSFPEELDVLDIEAELGRPDEMSGISVAEEPSSTEEEKSLPADEAYIDETPTEELAGADEEEIAKQWPAEEPIEEPTEERVVDDSERESGVETTAPLLGEEPGAEWTGLPFASGSRRSGELSGEPLWILLAAASVDRRSGVFVLSSSDVERRLFLDKGEVVIATSTAEEDRLVELLYREGRLSDEEYGKAALAVGASGRRIGAILVERGLISSRELFPLVRHHYESIVLDSFGWREGTWRFERGQNLGGERILLNVPLPTLIVEGVRSRARPEDIDKLVPAGCRPLLLPTGICHVEDVGLLPEELAVYNACDGTATVEQLGRRFGLPGRELIGLAAGLSVLGLLHLESGDDVRDVAKDVATPLVSRGDEQSFRVERARVADKMAQIKEASYFSILEISPQASGYEIRKAYRSLSGQFALERFAISELIDLREQVEVVREVLEEAYEILRNPELREAYRQAAQHEL